MQQKNRKILTVYLACLGSLALAWFSFTRTDRLLGAYLKPSSKGVPAPPWNQLSLGRADLKEPKVLLNTIGLTKHRLPFHLVWEDPNLVRWFRTPEVHLGDAPLPEKQMHRSLMKACDVRGCHKLVKAREGQSPRLLAWQRFGVSPLSLLDLEGNVIWEKPGFIAEDGLVADLNGDGEPELVVTRRELPSTTPLEPERLMLVVLDQDGKVLWQRPMGYPGVGVVETTEGVEVTATSAGMFLSVIAYDANGRQKWTGRGFVPSSMDWSVGSLPAYVLSDMSEYTRPPEPKLIYHPGLRLAGRSGTLAYLRTYENPMIYHQHLTLKNARGERFFVVAGSAADKVPGAARETAEVGDNMRGILMVYNQAQQAVYAEVLQGSCMLSPTLDEKDTALVRCASTKGGLYEYKLP